MQISAFICNINLFLVFLCVCWSSTPSQNLLDNGTRRVLFSYENDKMSTMLAVDDMIMPQINIQ